MQPLRGLLVLFAAARAELRVPSAPTDALLEIVGGDSVEVAWAPPLSDGGAAIQSYQVEWDTNPGVAEVQTVTTSTYLGANELQTIRTFGKDLCGNQPVRRVLVRNRHRHAIEQASRRWRGGRKILISTQARTWTRSSSCGRSRGRTARSSG